MKVIFFDLDDTLYFRKDAFFNTCRKYLHIEDADFLNKASDSCRKRGDEVFYQSQRGEISMKAMYIYRFQKGFADVNYYITEREALRFNFHYQKMLYRLTLSKEVKELLNFCKLNFDKIGIITNGPEIHQKNKIKKLKLTRWIDKDLEIISGIYKSDKPDLRLFEIAQEKSGASADQIIMIGDSQENDIIPAKKMKWKTIWLDLYSEDFTGADYTVKNIGQVKQILEKII